MTTDETFGHFLSKYAMDKIWNTPTVEYRKLIKPTIFSTASRGSVWYRDIYITLPDERTYTTFIMPNHILGGIQLSDLDCWTKLCDLPSKKGVEIRAFTSTGITLHRGCTFIKYDSVAERLIIAVNRDMYKTFTSKFYDRSDVILEVLYDSDGGASRTINTVGPYNSSNDEINSFVSSVPQASHYFVNGLYTSTFTPSRLSEHGIYVESYWDPNITRTETNDVSDLLTFKSSEENVDRFLIHVPATEEFSLLSHDTCDMYTSDGRYVHRDLSTSTIRQVSFSDIAVTTEAITKLGTPESLILNIRYQSKDNVLVRDGNFVDLLYTHTDAEIYAFLSGSGPEDIPFWKAEVLMESKYTALMGDIPHGGQILAGSGQIAEALGYYNSLSLLSPRIYHLKALDDLQDCFSLDIPPAMRKFKIYAAVYVNGLKIDSELVTVDFTPDNTRASINIVGLTLSKGDPITIELFRNVEEEVNYLTPSSNAHHLRLVTTAFKLYRVRDAVVPIKGIDVTNTKYFDDITDDISTYADELDVKGNQFLSFKSSYYGQTFIVTYPIGMGTYREHIDRDLNLSNPIVIDLSTVAKSVTKETTFTVNNHTGYVSPTGTVSVITDPTDEVTSAFDHPAWHLFDANMLMDPNLSGYHFYSTNGWRGRPSGETIRYTLKPEIEYSKILLGYRIGRPVSYIHEESCSKCPKSVELSIDGEVVDTQSSLSWYGDPVVIKTFLLDTPKLVGRNIDLKVGPNREGSEVYLGHIEYIWGEPNEEIRIPKIGDLTTIAFLNGRELTHGVDFSIVTATDSSDNIYSTQLVMHNVQYIDPCGGNIVEVITTRDPNLNRDSGFMYDNWPIEAKVFPAFLDRLTSLHVDGYNKTNISPDFGGILVDDSRQSAIFELRTIVPTNVAAYLESINVESDFDKYLLLGEYFSNFKRSERMFISPHYHKIAGIFTSMALRDLVSGTIVANRSSDDAVFLESFKSLDHIRPFDLTLTGPLNKRFIDIQASYVQLPTTDIRVYDDIKRLLTLTSELTDDVVHGRPDNEHR